MNLDSAGQALNSGAGAIASGPDVGPAGKRTEERLDRAAVLVLGMHRSGTSSLAGAMVRLGVMPPLNLIPPNDENPKGFWESTVIVALNDEILAAGGSHWEDWRPFDPGSIDPAVAYTLKTRARSALIREFGEASLAVVKDPRLCRLMPFWSSVLQDSGWSRARASAATIAARSRLIARAPQRHSAGPWLSHLAAPRAGRRGWNAEHAPRRRRLE